MGVADRDDLRTGAMHRSVQHDPDRVHRHRSVHQIALVVDLHEIADPDAVERDAERVGPEPIGMLGVADRHVAEQPLAESGASEDATDACEPFETMTTFFLDRLEARRPLDEESSRRALGGVGHRVRSIAGSR